MLPFCRLFGKPAQVYEDDFHYAPSVWMMAWVENAILWGKYRKWRIPFMPVLRGEVLMNGAVISTGTFRMNGIHPL